MNSVSLLTSKLQASRLENAETLASQRGGAVYFVPSPFPEAPSPFDFSQGATLAGSGYARAAEWVSQLAFGATPAEQPRGTADV
jgi:hypothetical protein